MDGCSRRRQVILTENSVSGREGKTALTASVIALKPDSEPEQGHPTGVKPLVISNGETREPNGIPKPIRHGGVSVNRVSLKLSLNGG